MKRISIVLYTVLFLFSGCQKDDTMIMLNSDITPPAISSPVTDFNLAVTENNLKDTITFAWAGTGYGVNTAVTYTLEADVKCNGFSKPTVIGTTTSKNLPLTLESLSAKLISDLKIAPHQQTEVQLRVTSVINNKFASSSALVSFVVTPWSDKPVALWLGENTVTAPVLYATAESTYEGYKFLRKGVAFRFSTNPWCTTVVYGDAGAGALEPGPSSNPITIAASGFYKINVDTEHLTYSMTLMETWGLIGTSTGGGWNESTPMMYDTLSDTWSISTELVSGPLKFRANNGWDVNYGVDNSDSYASYLVFDASTAVTIKANKNYTITLDFTQSKAPYKYGYSVVENGEPAHVWVPGGYQGFDPAKAPFLSVLTKGGSAFEGYINITSSTGIKFTDAPDYGHTNYGYGGTTGKLSASGPDIDWPTPGYYKFNVDTKSLTYTATQITTWGLIGTSTTGGWNTSTPMTYDAPKNIWKITTNLVAGALKFRANDGWDINYGPLTDVFSGSLTKTNNAISISESGNYTITLDFTRSKSPFEYSYTVVKN